MVTANDIKRSSAMLENILVVVNECIEKTWEFI